MPIPFTCIKSSGFLYGPCFSRNLIILSAILGPIRGNFCNRSLSPVLILMDFGSRISGVRFDFRCCFWSVNVAIVSEESETAALVTAAPDG